LIWTKRGGNKKEKKRKTGEKERESGARVGSEDS
jgi:hypothetical protein